MRKRILMLMMICTLLLTLSARAEDIYEQIDAALYRIVLRTAAGDTTLGSGVLYADSTTILTAEGCCREGELYAVGPDGEHKIQEARFPGGGLAILTLAAPSPAAPLAMAQENAQSLPFIFGANVQDERGTMPLYNVRADLQGKLRTLLFSSEEGLLPGAFLTDQNARITALITAQQMEGVGSYAGLGVQALGRLLAAKETESSSLLDCSLSFEDGRLTASWTDTPRTDGTYVITLLCDENQYYTTYETAFTERSLVIIPPPGHTYSVQVEHTSSEDAALPPDWARIKDYTLPLLPFRAFDFQAEYSMLSLPAGGKPSGSETPLTTFTPAVLTAPDRDIVLRADCSYAVSAPHAAALALEILPPDGQFFFDEQTITLTPDAAASDHILLPMDDLLASCARFSGNTLREGGYTLRFFLDGCLAGEFAFTVTADGEIPESSPVPALPAEEGFASQLAAKSDGGHITLTWDAASVPEGAKLRVYCLYGVNPYFSYQELETGAASAQLFAMPGYPVLAWAAWSKTGEFSPNLPIERQDQFIALDAAPASPLTAYSFRNIRIGLAASSDPQAAAGTDFLPQAPVTREMLSDRSTPIYFMTEDTYQISGTSDSHPLLIALITPDGLCFTDMGYYTFDLALQSSDLWLKDVSQLFADCEAIGGENAWPAGDYRLLYCIDGQIAGEFTFSLD